MFSNSRNAMLRLMKFLHTMVAIGLMGAMVCLLVVFGFLPEPVNALGEYASLRAVMGAIATYVFFPALGLTLLSGLMSIALSRAFRNAGWALAKLVSGIVLFEGGLIAVQGPIAREASLAARALAGEVDVALLGLNATSEWYALWVLMAVATFNVVFGVWRPSLKRISFTRGLAKSEDRDRSAG